jgi:hypothetical protein
LKILFIDTAHPFLWESMIADGHECIAADKFSLEEIYSQLSDTNGIIIDKSNGIPH